MAHGTLPSPSFFELDWPRHRDTALILSSFPADHHFLNRINHIIHFHFHLLYIIGPGS